MSELKEAEIEGSSNKELDNFIKCYISLISYSGRVKVEVDNIRMDKIINNRPKKKKKSKLFSSDISFMI